MTLSAEELQNVLLTHESPKRERLVCDSYMAAPSLLAIFAELAASKGVSKAALLRASMRYTLSLADDKVRQLLYDYGDK